MIDTNISLWTALAMFALPVGVCILLISIIAIDVIEGKNSKTQMKRFEKLYKKCVEIHGLVFAQKLYDMCRDPWIGINNVIAVFEHHCGAITE